MTSFGTSRAPSFRDRAVGAVLGSAIGDALGRPVEFVLSLREMRDRFGPQGVRGYVGLMDLPGRGRVAPYTDDTEMAEAVLRGRIERMYRAALILTFGGGTNEVQRDIIAMAGLGMPNYKN